MQKKIAVTSNLQRRNGDLRTKLKNKLESGMPRSGILSEKKIVCLFDSNQNMLLCTPLVYIHEHGPYKTFKKM